MDDRRLGEDEPDQAEMRFVERHLVGEPVGALAHRPELARALEIIIAKIVQPLGLIAEPKLGEALRGRRAGLRAFAESARSAR